MSTTYSPSNQEPNNAVPDDKDTTPQSKQQKRQSQISETAGAGTGTHELAVAVDDLLDQLQHKFDGVSSEIFGKLDDMTRRLDDLEASLAVSGDAASTNQAK